MSRLGRGDPWCRNEERIAIGVHSLCYVNLPTADSSKRGGRVSVSDIKSPRRGTGGTIRDSDTFP